MKNIQDKISNDLIKNHGLYTEFFFMFILIILWFEYIFPLLELIPLEEDPTMVLIIAGFVWFSALCFAILLPYWFKSWIFLGIESSYLLYLKLIRIRGGVND
jgi:hypothetical protein